VLYLNLEKSVESRKSAQVPGLYNYMKKVFIFTALTPNKVVENCSCIFYNPTVHGPL